VNQYQLVIFAGNVVAHAPIMSCGVQKNLSFLHNKTPLKGEFYYFISDAKPAV